MNDSPDISTLAAMNARTRLRWFLRRIACAVYDGLILIALFMFATALLMPFTGGAIDPPPYNLLFDLYLALVGCGYFLLVWKRDGQTLGMRAWRLRVISKDGGKLGAGDLLLRLALGLVGWLALGIGWLWMLVDKQGRGWQDLVGNSALASVPKPKK
ncbi:MAG: RDD family protein [Gammaproteobacteria bacterium]|nr:RDD family protein [Gammaproteobacteria bacterium]